VTNALFSVLSRVKIIVVIGGAMCYSNLSAIGTPVISVVYIIVVLA